MFFYLLTIHCELLYIRYHQELLLQNKQFWDKLDQSMGLCGDSPRDSDVDTRFEPQGLSDEEQHENHEQYREVIDTLRELESQLDAASAGCSLSPVPVDSVPARMLRELAPFERHPAVSEGFSLAADLQDDLRSWNQPLTEFFFMTCFSLKLEVAARGLPCCLPADDLFEEAKAAALAPSYYHKFIRSRLGISLLQ